MIDEKQVAVASATESGMPDGWREVRFDEIAQLVNDRVDNPAEAGVERYVGLEHLDPESLKIRRWGAPTDVEAQKLRFQPGDIIFGKRRAYQRKVAVADFEGICSAHAMVLRAREENVIKEFLPFFMQSDTFFDRALSISVGSLSPTINWKTLADQKFALPPKDEQRRIADILWAADSALVANQKLLYELTVAKQAIRSECLTRKTEMGWHLTTLDKVTERISVGLATSTTSYYRPHGVPLIRNQNIRPLLLDDEELLFLDVGFASQFENKRLKARDVITTRTGANIGQTCLVPEKYAGAHSFTTLIITCDEERLLPEYLVQHMNASVGVQEIERLSTSGGKGNLNVTALASYRIDVPPIAEQHEVVRALGAVDAAKNQLSDNIDSLRILLVKLVNDFIV